MSTVSFSYPSHSAAGKISIGNTRQHPQGYAVSIYYDVAKQTSTLLATAYGGSPDEVGRRASSVADAFAESMGVLVK